MDDEMSIKRYNDINGFAEVPNTAPLTVRSTPPKGRRSQRRSYWPEVFVEARACPGEWVRTEKWFNRSTAAQVASDIRNAHVRDFSKTRVRGFLPGDLWGTRWGNDPADADPDHFYIW